jgi:STE24 endopeptidase
MLQKSFLLLLLWLPAGAQVSAPPQSTSPVSAQNASATYTYTLPPDKLRKAEALYRLERKFRIINPVYSFLVLWALLSWGIAARYRNWAEKASCRRFLQALIFVPLLMLTIGVADLPLRAYGHHVALQFGLSVQKWGSWLGDYGKGEALEIAILVLVLWLMQTIIRRSLERWWFYFWLVLSPIILFLVFISPVFIEPIFNKFESLEARNPKLVDAIETVVQRGGLMIPRSRMYEMKASEKYTTLNAYVSGFGASKRVVVWDNTIQKLTIPETIFVFGHEMGHYVLHHILIGLVATILGLLAGLYIVFRMARWTVKRFGPQWQIRALHDWAALPMIFLLGGILGFFSEPIDNAFSRHLEHQADIYGLEVTHGINPNSQETAAHSFQILGELSLDYPYPTRLEVLWYWDHPPISDRVRFAHDYDPWSKGESPKYVK